MKDLALFTFAAAVCGLAALADFRSRRVPNYLTLPLLFLGLAAAFPGDPVLWVHSAVVLGLGLAGGLSPADVKLWLGALWSTAPLAPAWAFPAALLLSALAELALRLARGTQPFGRASPGAWRTLVYLALAAGAKLLNP